jgi:hypothetical protein
MQLIGARDLETSFGFAFAPSLPAKANVLSLVVGTKVESSRIEESEDEHQFAEVGCAD